MNKPFPPVVIVDETDREIGSAMLAEVWQKGFYHRIAVVFVLDDSGRMLLQLRGSEVKIYPGRWDQAAGGHVDEGYSYDQTAQKELAEETGIEGVELVPLGTFQTSNPFGDGRISNEFERVYLARVPGNIALKPELSEVSQLKWHTRNEIKSLLTTRPDQLTPGLIEALARFFPEFIN